MRARRTTSQRILFSPNWPENLARPLGSPCKASQAIQHRNELAPWAVRSKGEKAFPGFCIKARTLTLAQT